MPGETKDGKQLQLVLVAEARKTISSDVFSTGGVVVHSDSPARGGSDEPLEPPLDPPLYFICSDSMVEG